MFEGVLYDVLNGCVSKETVEKLRAGICLNFRLAFFKHPRKLLEPALNPSRMYFHNLIKWFIPIFILGASGVNLNVIIEF